MNKSPLFPKILLVVGGDPHGKDAGEIFLCDIVGSVPSDRLIRYSLVAASTVPSAHNQMWGRFESILDVHPAQTLRLFKVKLIRSFAQICLHLFQYISLIPVLAKRITRIAKEQGVDVIWIAMNSPQLIYLADRLARNNSISLVVNVWDPPERFINDQKIPKFTKKIILGSFANVIKKSLALGTASEGMKEEYQKKYDKDSVVLIHGIDEQLHRSPRNKLGSSSQLVIGFSGNLYSSKEWLALLHALNSVNWTIAEHKIILRLLGSPPIIDKVDSKMNIEYMGWRTIPEIVDILASCDIAYLPYWIDEKYDYVTRMCFPNKLSVYLAAGIPVFYHGSPDASPSVFMKKYRIGVKCHSHAGNDIIDTLSKFINDAGNYARLSEGIKQARQEELNLKTFQSRFAHFIMHEDCEFIKR